MSIELYYFSGTGNSLLVAKELKKKLPKSKLIPILKLQGKSVITTKAESIGIIFPVYAFSMPFLVADFLKRFDPSAAKYIFSVATRGGSPCRVFKDIDKLLKKKKKRLDAGFFVNMPNNYVLGFSAPDKSAIKECLLEMQKEIGYIKERVIKKAGNEKSDPHKSAFKENIIFPLITLLVEKTRYMGMEKHFYADKKCNSCKTCEKVCLSGKIKMKDKKPLWQAHVKCLFCLACLNYCPKHAIQVEKTESSKNGRYVNPKVTLKELAGQK